MSDTEKQDPENDSAVKQIQDWVNQCGTLNTDLSSDVDWIQKLTQQNINPQEGLPSKSVSWGDAPPKVIGPYELVELIGEGGMGTVWCGLQREPVNRKVAIKLIRSGMEHHLLRFDTERKTLALMNHSGIASLFDAGTTPSGQPYFIMEYVDGEDLASFVDRHRVNLKGRLQLFLKACEAIAYSHSQGVIHRDIKPSNIMVSGEGDPSSWNVKVIDFGLAKSFSGNLDLQHSLTSETTVLGSLPWMSPEQARNAGKSNQDRVVDERTDVFSLGVVLFQLLTGTTPIEEGVSAEMTDWQLLNLVQNFDPSKPGIRNRKNQKRQVRSVDRNPGLNSTIDITLSSVGRIGRELDWIVLNALENDPGRRYASVTDLAADIQRFVDHQPVKCRPPSTVYRLRKSIQRNRSSAWICLAATFFLALGLWLTITYAREAGRANQQAETASSQAYMMSIEAKSLKEVADTVSSRAVSVQRDLDRLDSLFLTSLERLHPKHAEFTASKKDQPFLREVKKQLDNGVIDDSRRFVILNKLASIWFSYGKPDHSRDILEAAVESHLQNSAGDFSREHAVASSILGRSYIELNRLEEGLQWITSANSMMEDNLEFEDPDYLRSRVALVDGYRRLGKRSKAMEICEDALARMDLIDYPVDEYRISFANILALFLSEVGRHEEALFISEQTLTRNSEVLGLPADLVKIYGVHTKVRILRRALRYSKATPLCRELLQLARERFGEQHSLTLEIKKDYGLCLFFGGQRQKGIEYVQEALTSSIEEYGDEYMLSLSIAADLGLLFSSTNRNREALQKFQYAFDGKKRLIGEGHPGTLKAMVNLGKFHGKMGNASLARRMLEDAFEKAKTSCGVSSPETFQAMQAFATSCFAHHKTAVGIDAMRVFLRDAVTDLGAANQVAVAAKYTLAEHLYFFGQVDECLDLIDEILGLPETYVGLEIFQAAMLKCEVMLSTRDFEGLRSMLNDPLFTPVLDRPEYYFWVDHALMYHAELLVHDEKFFEATQLVKLILAAAEEGSDTSVRCRVILGICMIHQGMEAQGVGILRASIHPLYNSFLGLQRNFSYLILATDRIWKCHQGVGDVVGVQSWQQQRYEVQRRFLDFQLYYKNLLERTRESPRMAD